MTAVRPVSREVTADLLARYDRPAPRYTSYPTAVEFHAGFTADDYQSRLAQADRLGEAPLSVYVHLPFCRERCLFCGCHVIIARRREVALGYLDLLRREVAMVASRLPNRRRLAQLHLGGGTPTFYSPEELTGLCRSLFESFAPLPGAELAIEVDPRVTTSAHLDALAALGFNRISLGVQDFTPEVQVAVRRVQSVDDTARIVEHARRLGFRGINVDLIYGLPLQTPAGFERTVEAILAMRVDRVAVYSFAHVPWMHAHQKKLPPETLPSPETRLELFAVARERFLRAGYEPIGMDHFARPDDQLARARREGRLTRNFQGYTVMPGEDVIGLGLSAIGDVRGAYVQNHKKLSHYRQALDDGRLPVERGIARTPDDEVRRAIIQELMCNFRIEVREIERRYRFRFAERFAEDLALLAGHQRAGLVRVGPDRIEATPIGELFIRSLALCFDRYMRERHAADARPRFSRTV